MLDYLTLKPEVFGIDISDLSLKIIKLKKRGGSLALASFGEMEIPSGIIEQGEIKDEDVLSQIIKKSLPKVKGEKINTKYIVASLPEEKAFLQVIQLPLMKKEEMEKAVHFEAENYIPMSLDKVYLDAQIVNPPSNHLDHLDVLMVALPKKIVDSYLSVFWKSGLRPLVFEMESQAIARSLVTKEKSSEPILLIDFGATKASLIIFSGHSLRFTTSFLVSSPKFTQTLSNNLKISFKEAENLKIKHGIEGAKGKEILNILRPDLTDLAGKIKTYLSYYQTHSSHEHLSLNNKGVQKIILCGGSSNLKGFDDFLSRELQLEVVLGNPWSNILPHPLKEVPELPYQESLRYATAIGLALRGVNL